MSESDNKRKTIIICVSACVYVCLYLHCLFFKANNYFRMINSSGNFRHFVNLINLLFFPLSCFIYSSARQVTGDL